MCIVQTGVCTLCFRDDFQVQAFYLFYLAFKDSIQGWEPFLRKIRLTRLSVLKAAQWMTNLTDKLQNYN